MDKRKEEVDCLLRETEEGKELVAEFPEDRSLMTRLSAIENVPTGGCCGGNKRKKLTKQLSMQETTREVRWEKRRRQILERRQRLVAVEEEEKVAAVEEKEEDGEGEGEGRRVRVRLRSLTDEDLDELKGCIELGFGFSEEEGGHDLRHTLPALDLYFAINRLRNCSSSSGFSIDSSSPPALSPRSNDGNSSSGESWKICNLGDDPLQVKTRLRHWAQAVACSLRQSC